MQILREIAPRLSCAQVAPQRTLPSLVDDVRNGLLRPPRQLPPKYFYDELGSQIFEDICKTPEYYPSRTEEALLSEQAASIVGMTRPDQIIELGSGSSRKTRRLFDACAELQQYCSYWPYDVAESMLLQAGLELTAEYDWLTVNALVGDYNGGITALPLPEDGRRLFLFLGGTIGNFPQADAVRLLAEVRSLLRGEDRLLLGADRVKAPTVLEAAYDDAAGITAAFNLNLLSVLNRELDGDFSPQDFTHRSVYDADAQQIEMRLRSDKPQRVNLSAIPAVLELEAGEEIRTEISRKFTVSSLEALLNAAGMRMQHHFEAPEGRYSLVLAGL